MNIKEKIISILPEKLRKWIQHKNVRMLNSTQDKQYAQECFQTGRQKEYRDYLKHRSLAVHDMDRFQKSIEKNEDPQRWTYLLNDYKRAYEFIRPNDPEDIKYRDYWREEFGKKLNEIAPKDLDLRFHGTSLHNTKAILESGGIFSSVDINDGYRSSTDLSGRISATSIETVDRTLKGWFAEMGGYIKSFPCGCIFALNPKDQTDIDLKKSDELQSVNFKEHPEQLYGIFTTDENIPKVQLWLQNAGLNPNLVTNFEGFLKKVDNENNKSKNIREIYAVDTSNTQPQIDQAEKAIGQTERLVRDDELER